MNEDNVVLSNNPASMDDLLTQIAKQGAQKMLAIALENEIEEFISNKQASLNDGRQRFVRNGYLPERGIQTGIGELKVNVPRVRDRETIKSEIQFRSSIVPTYLRKSVKMQEFLPLLYLKGISTGDFKEALTPLMGDVAKGLSANTICRLKAKWEEEFQIWNQRALSQDNYIYWWVDGIYFQARMEESKDCVLVVMGVTDKGVKELIAITDGYRESKESWLDLLKSLKRRGIKKPPKLAVADGALGFWGALTEVFPETKHQRCWVHKTANILSKLPKNLHAQAKNDLQQIWMAETKKKAMKAYDEFIAKYCLKYEKAVQCLKKDRDQMLAFYAFPAEHWKSIRTTNPIESTFATVRHRTRKSKGCYSRTTILSMVFKLCESAEKRWRRIHGFKQIEELAEGITFMDGIKQDKTAQNSAVKVAA